MYTTRSSEPGHLRWDEEELTEPSHTKPNHDNLCISCSLSLYMYIYTSISMYTSLSLYIYIYIHIYTYTYTHRCMYAYIYIYIYICTYNNSQFHKYRFAKRQPCEHRLQAGGLLRPADERGVSGFHKHTQLIIIIIIITIINN